MEHWLKLGPFIFLIILMFANALLIHFQLQDMNKKLDNLSETVNRLGTFIGEMWEDING